MRPRAWTVLSAVAALVGLLGGWLAAETVQPPGYDPVQMTISALARHGARDRWIMTAGLYIVGVAHLATAAGLSALRLPARVLLALGGVAGLGVAFCAQPAHGSADAHLAFAVLGVVALALFPVAVCRREAAAFPLRIRDAVASACLSVALLAWLMQATDGATLGLAERAITFQQTLWPVLVVLALRRELRTTAASVDPVRLRQFRYE
ncbi:MAG TPA: DUF998 domain-containing protein [Jatrophihabitans sp.]|nr:DUF998 domain-containing protein [Jatrophihabitans sp.]